MSSILKIPSRAQILLCIQRPINAWLASSLRYKDIDGSQYVVPNLGHHDRVVVLYKKELYDRVHVVHKDVDAHYKWIRCHVCAWWSVFLDVVCAFTLRA